MKRAAILLLFALPAFAAEPSKFTLAQSGGSADPLTVLGPAAVCAEHPYGSGYLAIPLLSTNTDLVCSSFYVANEEITAVPGLSVEFYSGPQIEEAGPPKEGTSVTIGAGFAAASTDTEGAAPGGDATLAGGDAARLTSGNANGGDVVLQPGSGVGTGTAGNVFIASGNLTGPAGGFSIIGGTGATDDLILDGSTGTAGAAAVTEDGRLIAGVGGSAAAPAFKLPGGASGMWDDWGSGGVAISYAGSKSFAILSGSTYQVVYQPDLARGLDILGTTPIYWSTGAVAAGNDVGLGRDSGAGLLAQKFSTQAQTFRLYGTADAAWGTLTNYARLSLAATDGTSTITTETAGTAADDQSLVVKGEGATATLTLDGSDDVAGSVTVSANGGVVVNGGANQVTVIPSGNDGYFLVGAATSDYTGAYFGKDASYGYLYLKGATIQANSSFMYLNKPIRWIRPVTPDIDGETTMSENSGTLWTNTGDGDGEAITLLNDPGIGVQYCFAVDVAQTITVAPSTGETLYYGTDNCVVSLTSNAIGSTLCVTAITGGSGAKWFTMSHEGSWTCND